jgi:hypothetical protein
MLPILVKGCKDTTAILPISAKVDIKVNNVTQLVMDIIDVFKINIIKRGVPFNTGCLKCMY